MHILVATDGTLDPDRAADVVARLYEKGDDVTVVTAVQFPREFLAGVARTTGVTQVADFAHEAGAGVLGIAGGAKAAERFSQPKTVAPSDHPLGQYFADTAHQRTDGLRRALTERGVESITVWASTENQTARTILDLATRNDADVLVIGRKGQGRFEGPLGSTVTKIARRAPMDVLIVR